VPTVILYFQFEDIKWVIISLLSNNDMQCNSQKKNKDKGQRANDKTLLRKFQIEQMHEPL